VNAVAPPPSKFWPFLVVATLGFATDAAILTILVNALAWSTYASRAVSFGTAITVTWLCNRHWVFERTRSVRKEYGTYLLTQTVGATINLGGFALLIELVPSLARIPVIPLAGGGILAMVFNYFAARRWVFVNPDAPAR
jgi:putative flippase GtrA